jgi:hypothetical protein
VVAGLVPPTAGRVRLEGPLPAPGWVPQHPTVLPATVLEARGCPRARTSTDWIVLWTSRIDDVAGPAGGERGEVGRATALPARRQLAVPGAEGAPADDMLSRGAAAP